MTGWELKLTEDRLRADSPFFTSLEERVAGYRACYCEKAAGKHRAKKHRETDDAQKRAAQNPRETGGPEQAAPPSPFPAPDDRKTEAPFSALLALYAPKGSECDEYTFSRRGMRHMRRELPWQGYYHTHDYIEILYVIQGNFQQLLLGSHENFAAGEFVITDRNLEHADFLSGEEETSVLFLSLQYDYLDQLLSTYDRKDDLQRFFFHALRRQQKEQSYLHLRPMDPGKKDPRLSHLLETLIAEDWNPAQGSGEIIRGCLIGLLSLLCRDYSMQLRSSDRESREKAFLYELERYIRMQAGQVTSQDLENVFHYHRNYFNMILRKYQGTCFREYVRKIRLEHATDLLTQTNLSTREVGRRCGWHNNSHFYYLFEQRFHMTPAEYRKSFSRQPSGSD